MSKQKLSALISIGLVLALALGALLPVVAFAADELKIGFLGALSGNVAIYGTQSLKGMKLAVEEINAAGGVLGKKLVIVEEDDRGDKTEVANIMQKYATQDKVIAVVGDPTTGATKVAAPIAQQNKIILISPGSTAPGVVEIGDYIFRDTLLDSVGAPAISKYIIQDKKWKRLALITSINNDFSVGLSKLFEAGIKQYGGQVVIKESISDGDTDFSAQITKIKAAKPDAIVFSGYYTEGALIMKEARKQGLNVNMVAGDGLMSPVYMELGGKAVEGSIFYTGFSPEQPTANTKKFLDAFAKKYNGEVAELFAAQGYDAVKIIAAALKKAGTTDPKAFRDAVAATKEFPGASGTITFLPNREPLKSPVYLLTVKDGQFKLLAKVPVKAQE